MGIHYSGSVNFKQIEQLLNSYSQKIDLFINQHYEVARTVGFYFYKDDYAFYLRSNGRNKCDFYVNKIGEFETILDSSTHQPLKYEWEEIIGE